MLLKGIEDLKRNGRPTLNLKHHSPTKVGQQRTVSYSASTSAGTSTSSAGIDTGGMGEANSQPTKGAVHWSVVTPLSENPVDGTGDVAVNLADGMYDEAAQQREFQNAVMAWRSGGQTTSASSQQGPEIDASDFGYGPTPSDRTDDGQWHNPWGSSSATETATESGTGAWRGRRDKDANPPLSLPHACLCVCACVRGPSLHVFPTNRIDNQPCPVPRFSSNRHRRWCTAGRCTRRGGRACRVRQGRGGVAQW